MSALPQVLPPVSSSTTVQPMTCEYRGWQHEWDLVSWTPYPTGYIHAGLAVYRCAACGAVVTGWQ